MPSGIICECYVKKIKIKKITTQKLPRIYKMSTRVFNSTTVEALQIWFKLSLQTRHTEIVNCIKINSHVIQRTAQNQAPRFLLLSEFSEI